MPNRSTLRLILQPLAIAVVLALGARAAIHVYEIPSASMAPTLISGDRIVVTPYCPFTTPHPRRGDVVVFRSPQQPEELMIKRVVATPGDLIESRAGRVLIGGHALSEPYLRTSVDSGAIAAQIIPAESYFMMGDNRADSFDSRNWGILPAAMIVGRARLILWSSADDGGAPVVNASTRSADARSHEALRLDRLFKVIE